MKRAVLLIVVVAALGANLMAQNDRTSRPRVAVTPTPPVLGNDQNPAPVTSNTPPVLGDRNRRPSPAPTGTPIDGDDEVIRVETNLVTMPVSVLDRDGRFISGLQQRDFKIFDNGVEQKIDYFQSVEQPFTVVLLIDVSPSTQFRMEEIQNAAITFVDQLRPMDKVMVIAFDHQVHLLTPATGNRREVHWAIRQARFGDGTSLYEAVDETIVQHLRYISGRKAVVLFTDGVDTTSRKATIESTLRAAEETDALFYPIRYDTSGYMAGRGGGGGGGRSGGGWPRRRGGGVTMADIIESIIRGGGVTMGGGGMGSEAEYAKGKQYLERLAQNSGGRTFEADSMYNLDAAFSGIAEELRRQYSLGYYPENAGTVGERRQIRIRVMRPNVVVRAKTSYIVGQNAGRSSGGR